MKYKVIGNIESQRETLIHGPRYAGNFGYINNETFAGESHKNQAFNQYLKALFCRKISVLDLGCGGGFIHDTVQNGDDALGIEGFSQYQRNQIHAWKLIPDNLQIMNIAQPFIITDENNQRVNFDVVTAWEVLEHLFEDEVDVFLKNVVNHIHNDSFICFTVSYRPDNGHFTIKSLEWWKERFFNNGLLLTEITIPRECLVRNCCDSHVVVLKKKP